MNFQFNNFKFKTKRTITFALLISFVFSNFAFLPLKSLALDPPSAGQNPQLPDFNPGNNPGDPGFIGPVQPGGGGILATISGGICGTIDSIKGVILGKAIDAGENAASNFINSGIGALGLSESINGAFQSIPGIAGNLEVPTHDQKVMENTQQIKKDTNALKTKETCQDTIIVPIARYFIRQMTKDLINWIKGKDGQPRFIQNFGDFLKKAGDNAGGILLEQILGKGNAEKLCEPWKVDIALKILGPPSRKDKFEPQCKISEIIGAAEEAGIDIDIDLERQKKRRVGNFINNFSEGGWPAFLTSVFDDSSNYPGYALTLMDKKERLEAKAKEAAKVEAISGSGILAGVCMEKETLTLDAHGEKKGNEICKRSKIFTPGAAIVGALPDSLQSDLKQLEVADEINEIVFALAGVMTQKKFWEGIIGSDEPDSEGNILRGFNGIETTDELGNPLPDEFNTNNVNASFQNPFPLKPKNNVIIATPIEFDWTEADLVFEKVKNYQIFIIFPDGREKTINTKTAINLNDIAPSKYQMTKNEFQEFDIGGTYIWRVAAINNNDQIINGASGISEANSFVVPMSAILSPIKHSVISDGPIKFKWASMDLKEVFGYKLELTNLTLSNEPPFLKDVKETEYTQTQEEFNAMLGGRYFLKITAIDENGAQVGAENHIRFFLLTPPKLITPQNKENISVADIAAGVNFDWDDALISENRIINYEINIRKETGGFSQREETTTSEFMMNNLGQNDTGKYIWKVRSIFHETATDDERDIVNQDVISVWSNEREFELTE